MDTREQKGLQIAQTIRISKITDRHWVVPSQTGTGKYVVDPEAGTCGCPNFESRGLKCKHLWAVEYARHQVTEPDGSVVVTETLKVSYSQNWPAYNAAQVHEKEHVEKLLKSLCAGLERPEGGKRGRPCLAPSDVIFGATMKVFSGMSGRRASTGIREAEAKGYIDHSPHYNSISAYLEKPELTPVLTALIEESSAPLKSVEEAFAIDATGFSTSVYSRWFDHRYGRERKYQNWLKCHAMVGVKTNVITSVAVTEGNVHDAVMLPELLESTSKRFNMAEVSADKAYLSHKNLQAIEGVGASPWIPFKSNNTAAHAAKGSPEWQKLFHLFNYKKDEFLKHYHKRSNVESTFSMIKRKFGGSLRSKRVESQTNEVLCKVLAHNLSVLVHEMYELGVEPMFWAA